MQKLVKFLLSVLILATTAGLLWAGGAIYDTSKKQQIETYFFQPNNLSSHRVGVPASPSDLGTEKLEDRLLTRFVVEYFYVVPDTENIQQRIGNMGLMRRMANGDVLTQWIEGPAQEIEKLANKNVMRMVHVDEIIRPQDSEFVEVKYSLKTWDAPNEFAVAPVITNGVILLRYVYEDGIRQSILDMGIHKYFDMGGDAAGLFKFMVTEIE